MKRVLLGISIDGNFVFAEYGVKNGIFSASFDVTRPVNFTEIDVEEVVDNYLNSYYCKDNLYDMCADYDCTPNYLWKQWLDRQYNKEETLYELVNTSGFDPYWFNGSEYVFDHFCSVRDPEGEMLVYTNKTAYDMLMILHRNFHLKKLNEGAEMIMIITNEGFDDTYNTKSIADMFEEWYSRF